MFGIEPEEKIEVSKGQKLLIVFIGVVFFSLGLWGVISGKFYLPSRFSSGYSLEGIPAYLVSASFFSLSSFFFFLNSDWRNNTKYQRLINLLFLLALLLLGAGLFMGD